MPLLCRSGTMVLLVLLVNTRSVLAPPGLSQTGLPTQRRVDCLQIVARLVA